MRDFQKQRVYDAEFMLRNVMRTAEAMDVPTFDFHGSTLYLPRERRFACLDSMQAYVDQVLGLNWVRATFPAAEYGVKVVRRRGQAKAHYQLGQIHVPMEVDWALREIVLLHEIAHHLTPGCHSPEFAGGHWTLINEIIGQEVGLVYSWCQDVNGVQRKFNPVRVSA
jgi:putative metallohydrolase (TIGR04338 family)